MKRNEQELEEMALLGFTVKTFGDMFYFLTGLTLEDHRSMANQLLARAYGWTDR